MLLELHCGQLPAEPEASAQSSSSVCALGGSFFFRSHSLGQYHVVHRTFRGPPQIGHLFMPPIVLRNPQYS